MSTDEYQQDVVLGHMKSFYYTGLLYVLSKSTKDITVTLNTTDNVSDRMNEKLIQEINRHVSQSKSDPVKSGIAEQVEQVIHRIVEEAKALDPRWDFNVIPTGSFYEDLRVGLPFEFDYMLELNWFTENPDHIRIKSQHSEGGWKTTLHVETNRREWNVSKLDDDWSDFDGMLIFFNLCKDLYKALILVKEQGGLAPFQFMGIQKDEVAPNFCVVFKLPTGEGVMIDLVPCIKLPNKCEGEFPKLHHSVETFLKSLFEQEFLEQSYPDVWTFVNSNLHMVLRKVTTSAYPWQYSTSYMERLVMEEIDESFKTSYRVMKYLLNTHTASEEPLCTLLGFPFDGLNYANLDDYMQKYMNAKLETTPKFTEERTAFETAINLAVFGRSSFVQTYKLKTIFLILVSQVHATPLYRHYVKSSYAFFQVLQKTMKMLADIRRDDCPMLNHFFFQNNHIQFFDSVFLLHHRYIMDGLKEIEITLSGIQCLEHIKALELLNEPGIRGTPLVAKTLIPDDEESDDSMLVYSRIDMK